jgi:cytochrome P450
MIAGDLLDPALHASGGARELMHRLRTECPVAWRAGRRGPGYWAITGYNELALVARDTSTFSSWWGTRPEVTRPLGALRPLHNTDPPEHGVLRQVAARTVAAQRLAELAPVVQAAVDDAIGDFVARRRSDAVQDLAVLIPARIFASWMGLGQHREGELAHHVERVHAAGAALLDTPRDAVERFARVTEARAATLDIADWMRTMLLSGDTPAESALGILREELEARRVGHEEAVALAALLALAGLPTMTDALSSGIADLYAHPEAMRALARSRTSLALGVEEILRRASPIAQFARMARRPATLCGRRIEAGQQLVLWFSSANRDERVFADAEAFLPARAPNPHIAFGVGPHRCLGSAFARQMLRAFFSAWCSRIKRVDQAGPFEPRASSYQRGFVSLPISVF